jgi:aspartyl-tRNA synthetase
MATYCSDKPDLRNPLIINDVTEAFASSGFKVFADIANKGGHVKAIKAPSASSKTRKFYDSLNAWARDEKMGGLGYIIKDEAGVLRGPIAKNLDGDQVATIFNQCSAEPGDAVFFVAGFGDDLIKSASAARNKICDELELREQDVYRFCWVVDFPMYEKDPETGKIDFSHNPFSMPQGGQDALETMDPLEIKAFQYDIVCNGVELSSGAIRNHKPEIMYKAFEIAGYDPSVVDEKFSGMINAFKFGAPPHGGCAPGIDRIIMLLADEDNIREVIPFPMNQQAQDLMMNAPSSVSPAQLKELSIALPKNDAP